MGLEDHAGDMIRKSRMGLGIEREAVAALAQVTDTRLADYEDAGTNPQDLDLQAVAARLELAPEALQAVAQGWVPAAHDLNRWQHLEVIESDEGGMSVNCFLIWDEATREAALFDTGWSVLPIAALVEQHQLQLTHLFITHSHYDHIEALADVRKLAPEAAIHSNIQGAPKAQQLVQDDSFAVGSLRVSHRETPGHAADGVTFVVEGFPGGAPAVAVVGDAIFAGSMGGAPQHFELAKTKVREAILSLPDGTLICPGHGPVTTVGEEKSHNPFFA